MNTKDIPKVELKLPGEKVTMLVEQARKEPFGNYPGLEFCGKTGAGDTVVVVVPLASAKKQLDRLGLDAPDAEEHYPKCLGLYLTIMREENKQQPTRPYWAIYLAREGEFEAEGEGAEPLPPKRMPAPPAEDYGAELKRDPHGRGEQRAAAPSPQSPQREVSESQARPKAAEPITAEELTDAEKRNRKRMAELSRVYDALWEDSLRKQFAVVAKMQEEGIVPAGFKPTAESAGAAAATKFIQFNMRNLL